VPVNVKRISNKKGISMDPITRRLVETVRQITEGYTPDAKRVVTEPRAPAIFYDYTQKLSERPRWEKVAADMGIDSSGIEQMSSQVHDEWMKRNPKADWNAAQHVPYEQLPESEKAKDREHVQQILVLHRENVAEPNTSLETHIDRLANAFGAQAHEAWRAGWEEKNGKDTPRMKSVSGGTQVNINVPWKDLHPEWKRENYQAGVAAARALYNAPSPSGPPVPTPDLKEAAMSDTLKAGLASLIIGGGIGAIGGVATPHLANLRAMVQDKMGQVVGVENAGNIERSKQEVRSQLGLGANTPATTRAAVGVGLGGLAGLIQSWRKRNNV